MNNLDGPMKEISGLDEIHKPLKKKAKPVKESWVKEEIKKLLKEFKVYYFMPMGQMYGRSGIPDFICCFNGLFIGIEAKAGKNPVSDIQAMELSRIHRANGITLVINETNLDSLRTVLMKLNTLAQHSIVPKHL